MTKALTLTQPWASLVMAGVKRIETRGWQTSYRGPLVIHAAKGWTSEDREFAQDWIDTGRLPGKYIVTNRSVHPDLPLGAALGTVWLVNVVRVEDIGADGLVRGWRLTPLERELGDYSPGRFAWLLADPEPFAEPIPARGRLGLWDFEVAA